MARQLRVEYPRQSGVAVLLRPETVMPVKWIAERLQMGTGGYVNHLLYQRRKAGKRII
jgi:hypothetical protein